MNSKHRILAAAGAAVVVLSGLALAGRAAKKDVIWPAEAIQWQDGPVKGVKVAALWGGMDKSGPYGALLKFDAGLTHALHHHTQSLKIVVISGTFLHQPEGGEMARLGPGSYLLQASGRKHVSGCAPEAECQFFMTSADKFDLKIAAGAKPGQ
jgi:anti-sigma factor ChrR (cupin superfamily)